MILRQGRRVLLFRLRNSSATQRVSACASSSSDSGATASDSQEAEPLNVLAGRLDAAIAAEDYALAATLRDELERRKADGQEAVEEANRKFYEAFRTGDMKAMSAIWGHGDHVQCIHPVSACIAGRDDVMASWDVVLNNSGRLNIRLSDVRVAVTGGSQAFVTCTELVTATDNRGRIVATNVFEKQGGEWKIVLHHGSPQPDLPLVRAA